MASLIDSISSGASALKQKFHYGPHPSIFMWEKEAVAATKKDENPSLLSQAAGAISSARTKLESLTTSQVPSTFNSFKFDAIISEGHDAETIITKRPVSSGFLVSDHGINQNRVLKVSAVATNLQNSSMWGVSVQGLSVVSGAIFNNPVLPAIGGLYGLVSSAFESEDRVQSTYNLFNSLRMNRTKLYISTILGTYLNCVITRISVKHDKETAAILAIELTLEELQVVGSDKLADQAAAAIATSYDYSAFAKMAMSLGIGVLGGAPLPGLGSSSKPADQLSTLKSKLSKLSTPVSSVKGRIL